MKAAVRHQVSLKPYNTMGVEARAKAFVAVSEAAQLPDLIARFAATGPVLVLGGGSNILFTRDFEGLVLKNDLKGIAVLEEGTDQVRVRAAGGEDWHAFVCWCLGRGYSGLENLSLIPGTVGAAPVQNIGAYGVEAGDRIEAVEAVDLATGASCRFAAGDCDFAYRSSIFKTDGRGRYLITAVTFLLDRRPRLVITYADVARALGAEGGAITPQRLSDLICGIRRHKLPDPGTIPNLGSFFKNPLVDPARHHELAARFPGLPVHPAAGGKVKLSAGWMIEQCGWKGRRAGGCGVYDRHALVLVNPGGAAGRDILHLADAIRASVDRLFGVQLEPEPLIL